MSVRTCEWHRPVEAAYILRIFGRKHQKDRVVAEEKYSTTGSVIRHLRTF